MEDKFSISPGTCFAWAFMFLMLPHRWITGFFGAALIHELSHILLLLATGSKITQLKFNPMGAIIGTTEQVRGEEALCASAGPAGSLLTAWIVKRIFPEMSICALVQGIFNLLPVYPLDGGRMIRCLASEATAKAVQVMTLILLWGFGIWAGLRWNLGLLPLFPAFAATRAAIPRKIPCKEPKLAVQ